MLLPETADALEHLAICGLCPRVDHLWRNLRLDWRHANGETTLKRTPVRRSVRRHDIAQGEIGKEILTFVLPGAQPNLSILSADRSAYQSTILCSFAVSPKISYFILHIFTA